MAKMSLSIKNCLIFDPNSKFHSKEIDVLIEGGKITSLKKSLNVKNSIDAKGKWLTPSLVDLSANFCDPGIEHKDPGPLWKRCRIIGDPLQRFIVEGRIKHLNYPNIGIDRTKFGNIR